ncbi:hypothetical protein AB6A40_011470 [Gnathostoma spinigerum]|uniref:Uncharacterized protein n=1 Tax=Gnathostoma spinigerum TaxID=75299 RepID=A0ABD6F305_9BILA
MIKKWSNNSGELTYRLNETFHFDETYSCTGCSVNDRFLVPNPIYAKFIVLLHDPEALLKTLCEIPETGDALCSLLTTDVLKNYTETYASEIVITTKAFNIDPFISLSVDELLFTGYKDPLFTNLLVTLRNAVKRIMFPSPDDQPPPTFLMFPSPKIILNVSTSIIDYLFNFLSINLGSLTAVLIRI